MKQPMIYLDNSATTPTDPRVVEQMLPYFYDLPGNAASRTHAYGWQAEEAVSKARQQVAGLLGVDKSEIVFTSGATEAVNLAIKGVYDTYQRKGKHLITVKTEHKAVLDSCQWLEERGAEVTYLEVDEQGRIDLKELENAIREDTILVAVMWANNETGVIQDVATIGEICNRREVFFFCDGTQAVGKIPVDPVAMGVHLLAFSAHKMYGPKGVGALYVRRKNPPVKLTAQLAGGGHERGRRSGTLNVPGIVGFGAAAALAQTEMMAEIERLSSWRDQLEIKLLESLERVKVNGSQEMRLPQITNLCFEYADAEDVMRTFNQVLAVSSGSACTSASLDPSHVLKAMGLSSDQAHASLRLSFGRFNQEEDVDRVTAAIVSGVNSVRADSPLWRQ
ncbi:cysteine desulfurase family protein [Lewinella sp. LCG006]|uniref:cysteine desulfurase family protein n=1 Tax=Lewinella sp. LCG006 TaxID=3231911 RepID=UPI0034613993